MEDPESELDDIEHSFSPKEVEYKEAAKYVPPTQPVLVPMDQAPEYKSEVQLAEGNNMNQVALEDEEHTKAIFDLAS